MKNVKLIKEENSSTIYFKCFKNLVNFSEVKKVLIHDAARPNFSLKLLGSIIKNMKKFKAVIPKINIQDAVKQKINSSLNEYIIGKK